MKSRFARLGVLFAAVGGLMATMVPSASATTVKTVTFVGNADLFNCAGLGYVGLHGGPSGTTVKNDPKGLPQVNIESAGNHCDFTFGTIFCEKESVSTPDKPNFKTGVDPCDITAVGVVLGWCGWSTGAGTALIDNLSGGKGDLNNIVSDFKFTGIAGELVITGGTADSNIRGLVTAVPDPTSGSCTNKTATGFIIAGEVVIKQCTAGSPLPDFCPPV